MFLPFKKAIAVTKSDASPLSDDAGPVTARAITVTVAGTVVIVNHDGDDVAIQCVPGIPMPVETKWVKNASTATGIVALY